MRPATLLALLGLLFVGASALPAPARGMWPSPVFEENIALTFDPVRPTQDDEVTVVIRSLNETAFIKGASIYMTFVSPENVSQGPFPYPMVQSNPYQYSFTVPAYPNGTTVRFYVLAWDFDNDQLTSGTYEYTVEGVPSLGWQHANFDDNVEVSVFPPLPQPHDAVRVSIRSREPNVAILGANLYLSFIYQNDPPRSGGFVMGYANATHLETTIPGFPPGTEVIFWVVAWDKYVNVITSPFYSYNLSVDKYTRHENAPWPQPEALAGTSVGLALLVPVAAYYADLRRRSRRPE